MKDIGKSLGVAFVGLVSSVLTALAEVAASKLIGINLFTLSAWVVVPVGAVMTGIAAASGYYFGSLYFHKRPDGFLLLQMVVIAGLTQVLIYYLGYATSVLDDGRRVSDLIPFAKHLDYVLTSGHYRVGRTMADTGEVGSLGYWMAALQFVGFLLGGLAIFGYLLVKPFCKKCDFYLRPLAELSNTFPEYDSAKSFYEELFQHPVDSFEFAVRLRAGSHAVLEKGAIKVETVLYGCPKCKSQLVDEKVKIYNGSDWTAVGELNSRMPVSDGENLIGVFKP